LRDHRWTATGLRIPKLQWISGQLAQALRETNGRDGLASRRLHVLLGSSHCRFLLIENTGRLKNDAEVLALAARALKDRLGLEPSEWISAIDRQWNQSALVCAIRTKLLEELSATAAAGQCRLTSVRPWIGEYLRAQDGLHRKLEALGVIEPDAVSLLSGPSNQTQVQTLPVNEGADPLEALRYLKASAGLSAQPLPLIRFEVGPSARATQRGRSDFVDRTTTIQALA